MIKKNNIPPFRAIMPPIFRGSMLPIFCTAMLIMAMILPIFSFAAPKEGDLCTTDYVGTLVGSDGGYYYRAGQQKSIQYNEDGTTESFVHENFDGPRKHYLIKPDGQGDYYGYCVEQGLSYPDANRYSSDGWENDKYFSSLPLNVRNGIMLATIFGRQPNKEVPVAGCNDDDWYWATQVVIWEYQQQLRSTPTKLSSNGLVTGDYFRSTLEGRPAEKCYNYILASMAEYQKLPSFASAKQETAPMNILQWDGRETFWRLTVRDENGIDAALFSNNPNIKIQKNGSEYVFTSTKALTEQTISLKKQIALPSHDMLIWGGNSNTQAIATGTGDPLAFYMRVRTERPGNFELQKISEDNSIAGISFRLTDENGQTFDFVTDEKGVIQAQLYPGTYELSEQVIEKYRTVDDRIIQILEDGTTKVGVENILKKGMIQVKKSLNDTSTGIVVDEIGALFQIYSAEFEDYDMAPAELKDLITTDELGMCTSKELPLGDYVIRQVEKEGNITVSPDVRVSITTDLQTISVALDNHCQLCKLQVFKTNNVNTPLAEAVFSVKAATDILGPDGSIFYETGATVDTIITDGNGLAKTKWLYPGHYQIEEIQAPKGYELPEDKIAFVTLVAKNKTDIYFVSEMKVVNDPIEHTPETGDGKWRSKARTQGTAMLLSVIGMVLLACYAGRGDKTIH
jgi:hypothetical protein